MAGDPEPAGDQSESSVRPGLPSLAVDVAETPLTPGTWCWNAPRWSHPFLPHDRQDTNTITLT